jgi:hypothetical protein
MNALERQLTTLLTEAPGEPPDTLDPDALLAHARSPRRRYLAPSLAAAAVVAIALPVALVLVGDDATTPSRPASSGVPTGSTAIPLPDSAPKEEAMVRIEAALAAAPLPPGATTSPTELNSLIDAFDTSLSPNEVRRSAWWLAPGDVDSAVGYLKANEPDDMHLQSWGSGSGYQDVEFASRPDDPADYPIQLGYYLAPYESGIAIRVDASTTWAPVRPDWSFVPDDVTSVDLVVVRTVRPSQPQQDGGAPTVRQTLTGAALAGLADAINVLPSRAPEGMHGCPLLLVEATDIAVFHAPEGDLKVMHGDGGCAFNAVITSPTSDGEVYVPSSDFTAAVLAALGLPDNYGYQR